MSNNAFSNTPPSAIYDAAIIGGGFAGLTCGALLARSGCKVIVLEKEPRLGGLCAGFDREGYKFESAIHWLNQFGTDGFIPPLFRLLGNDFPTATHKTRIKRYVCGDTDYLVTNNPLELKDKLIQDFPEDTKGIIRFFDDTKKLAAAYKAITHNMCTSLSCSIFEKIKHHILYSRHGLTFLRALLYNNAEKALNRYFTHPRLRRIFSTEETLMEMMIPIAWAWLDDYQNPPPGGSREYALWLAEKTAQYGGTVLPRATVDSILLSKNKVCGLTYTNGGTKKTIHAPFIVAACDVNQLYSRLLPPGAISPRFIRSLNQAEIYTSAVTISIGLDCPSESLGMNEEFIHLAREDVSRNQQNSGDPHVCPMVINAYSAVDKTLCPEGCGTLLIFIAVNHGFHNSFNSDTPESADGRSDSPTQLRKRSKNYREYKQQYADIIIERLEKTLIPNLRGHIKVIDVATPLTYERYTWNKDGSMMGAKPVLKNILSGVIHSKSKVKNLLLTGHWADVGGGVPIAIKTAANTALYIARRMKKPFAEELKRTLLRK